MSFIRGKSRCSPCRSSDRPWLSSSRFATALRLFQPFPQRIVGGAYPTRSSDPNSIERSAIITDERGRPTSRTTLGKKPNGPRARRRLKVVDCFEMEAQGIEFFPHLSVAYRNGLVYFLA